MSHYLCFVLIPGDGDVGEHVERIMAPFEEHYPDHIEGESDEDYEKRLEGIETGIWDWFQIGGRWSGHLTGGEYDPEKDPANWQVCDLCGGTGTRTMPVPGDPSWQPTLGKCNGCDHDRKNGVPLGMRVSWPTQWVSHDGDVRDAVTVALMLKADPDLSPYTVVVDGGYAQKETYRADGATIEERFVPEPNFRERVLAMVQEHATAKGRVVVVDYHC